MSEENKQNKFLVDKSELHTKQSANLQCSNLTLFKTSSCYTHHYW